MANLENHGHRSKNSFPDRIYGGLNKCQLTFERNQEGFKFSATGLVAVLAVLVLIFT